MLSATSELKKAPPAVIERLAATRAKSPLPSFDSEEGMVSWATEGDSWATGVWDAAVWDSCQLGVECGKVRDIVVGTDGPEPGTLEAALYSTLLESARSSGIEYLFFCPAQTDSRQISGAFDAGLRSIGKSVEFVLNPSLCPNAAIQPSVRLADNADTAWAVRMADQIQRGPFSQGDKISA